jgi:uncharacterized membrane protein
MHPHLDESHKGIHIYKMDEQDEGDVCNLKKDTITFYELVLKYKLFKIPFIYIIVIYFFLMFLFEAIGIEFQMNKLIGYTFVIAIVFCFFTMQQFKSYALKHVYILILSVISLALILIE